MANKIICIAREFRSGWYEIAVRTASKLGIRLYEKDLFQLQNYEIRKIAQPENCIFVGRCADFVLREQDVKMLKVFVQIPVEWRIKRKMQ